MKAPLKSIAILILVLFSTCIYCQQIVPQACLEFWDGECTRCKKETHLYEGICYLNILGCLQYKNGAACSKCDINNFKLELETCKLIAQKSTVLKLSLAQFSGKYQSNPGDQYGESSFNPSSLEEVKNFKSFQVLDSFIRKGQYGHYISRINNPIFSVHYYQKDETYIYKLIYLGSGGGLFLCIADVPPSFAVQLRSLTPISASNIVDNCFDYDSYSRCIGCKDGNHLQGGKCYHNSGGCLKYKQNLCIQCIDRYLLVQNRCVSDCSSVSDSRSILYYESSQDKSSIERFYGISISNFYFKITNSSSKTIIKTAGQNSGLTQKFKFGSQSGIRTINQTNFGSVSIVNTTPLQHKSFYKQIVMPQIIIQDPSILKSVETIETTNSGKNWNQTTTYNESQLCTQYGNNGKCIKCVQFFYLNSKGLCEELSSLCISINPQTGACIKCFSGYILNQGKCDYKTFS